MGNGNGRSDVLYALVDDVSELKAKTSRYEDDIAAIRENQVLMRKQLSDMMALMQAMADKLVAISAKLDDHEQRLVRIETLLASWKH